MLQGVSARGLVLILFGGVALVLGFVYVCYQNTTQTKIVRFDLIESDNNGQKLNNPYYQFNNKEFSIGASINASSMFDKEVQLPEQILVEVDMEVKDGYRRIAIEFPPKHW